MGSIARMAHTDRVLQDERVKALMEQIETHFQSKHLEDHWWDQEIEMKFCLKATLRLDDFVGEVTLFTEYWDPDDHELEDLIEFLTRSLGYLRR